MSTNSDATIEAAEDARNPVLHLLRSYGRPHWPYFAGGLALQTLGQIPGRVPGLVIGIAFDAVFRNAGVYRLPLVPPAWIPETRVGQFWFSAAVIAGAYLAGTVLSVAASLTYGWFNQRLLHDVRTDTYDAMQRLSMGFFDGERTGEIISVLNNDVDNLRSFTGGTLGQVIRFPLSVGIAFGFMAWLSWQLALVLLFVPVLIAASSFVYSRLVGPLREEDRARVGELNSRLENNLSGVATIKAYATEDDERERVEDASYARVAIQLRLAKLYVISGPLASTIQNFGTVAVILVGGYWILSGPPAFFGGTLTAGALVTFIFYVRSFTRPMRGMPGIVDNYQNAKASAKRIVGLLATPHVIPEADDAVELGTVEGRVEYDDVTFSYDAVDGAVFEGDAAEPDVAAGSDDRERDQTIRNASFDVASGRTIGLVGPTGSGKSTLMKLLFRFYDVDSGAVRIDGHDVRDVTLRSLRRSIGHVGQEPFLFYGTVRENVAYGAPDATDEDVRWAARRAGAHDFVENLPDGYDTMVGERGLRLSGGQRQRVAIARAIVRDPAVLVLDEATSHVDNETEAVIQRNLETLAEDRTTFVIAHRLSTVRNADRILVLDDGEIVERGTHAELLDADGLYANLWRVQVGDVASLPASFVERTRRRQRGEAP